MRVSGAMDSSAITGAVLTTLNPNASNSERKECFKIVEEYKNSVFQLSDLPLLCGPTQHPSVILFGLQCLEYRIKHSWLELDPATKNAIKESLFQLTINLHDLIPADAERKAVVSVLTHIFVYLIKCEWPQQWPSMLDDFITLGRKGQTQAKLALNTFLRLYEDMIQFTDVPHSRRRDIMSSINDGLLQLFSFALEIILEQMQSLSDGTSQHQNASLCREALSMLSGFLDTCRLDIISHWKPQPINKYSTSELPFLRIVVDLIWIKDTRTDAIDLLLLLLKRKVQLSEELTFTISKFLLSDAFSVNRLLTVLRTTLNELTVFSESVYNSLILLAEVVARLGCTMVMNWPQYAVLAQPCDCEQQMQLSCANQCTHLLDCMVRIAIHPIRMISSTANAFWIAAFRSTDPMLIDRIHAFLPTLFVSWRQSMRKDGSPTSPGVHGEWTRGLFDVDDYSLFFARYFLTSSASVRLLPPHCYYAEYRSGVMDCLRYASSQWPAEVLQMVISMSNGLLDTPLSVSILDNQPDNYNEESDRLLVLDWDSLESMYNNLLPTFKTGLTRLGQLDQFDLLTSSLLRRFLQGEPPTDPYLRGKQLTCATILMRLVDTRHDAELLVPLLMRAFSCLRYNPATIPQPVGANREKAVKQMHSNVAVAFFRLTRACPERIMPHFQAIGAEVSNLWADAGSGIMEKCILLEALILLCLRLPQPIEVQRDLIKELVSPVTSAWASPPTAQQSPLMTQLLSACATGGRGLMAILGLEQPISTHVELSSPHVQMRITLAQNVFALHAATRRLVDPISREQLEHITVPFFEPLLPSVLLVLRAFNEMSLPEARACVHPTVQPAFELSDHIKSSLLSLKMGNSEKRPSSDTRSPLDRIRTGLHEYHEHLFNIMGSLFVGLTPRVYSLPTNQLATLIHQGCCAAFEHLPELRLNSLLRSVIRPFILHCPSEYLSTALVPLIPPILEAVIQRLDVRWNQIAALSNEKSSNMNEELTEERLTRLLSRTTLDMMRLLYAFNGYEPSSTSHAEAMGTTDDVDMITDARSNASTGAGPSIDINLIGALAKALMATAQPDSGCVGQSAACPDPLLLRLLSKCLTWPDALTSLKATQWIPQLIDALVQPPVTSLLTANHNGTPVMANVGTPQQQQTRIKLPLAAPLAETVMWGVLCALHIHGKNGDTNVSSLIAAGVRVYTTVDLSVAGDGLRALIAKVLLNASDGSDGAVQVYQAIQNCEAKLFNKTKPASDKIKRDALRKLLQPIIGIPLNQQFRDDVALATMNRSTSSSDNGPLARAKWRRPTQNGDSFPDSFGLSKLFTT